MRGMDATQGVNQDRGMDQNPLPDEATEDLDPDDDIRGGFSVADVTKAVGDALNSVARRG